jgi:hypothetical protein
VYKFDFTDQNPNRSFSVAPYTTNGPQTPNTPFPDARATSAATTLLLYGKASLDYGERIQENLLHLLENFASGSEPVYPIGGQIWLDRSQTPHHLRVFNTSGYEIKVDVGHAGNNSWFAITPRTSSDEADLLTRLVQNFSIRIFNDTTGAQENYIIVADSSTNGAGDVAFQVTPSVNSPRATGEWHLGSWEYILQNNTSLRSDLDGGNVWTIKNIPDPVDGTDPATKDYVDTQIASNLSGKDELVELNDVNIVSPQVNEFLAYNGVNWVNVNGGTLFVKRDGSTTMTGSLNMTGNTINNLQNPPPNDLSAATKLYVDTEIAAVVTGSISNLNDLADVTFGTPIAPSSLMTYTGSIWTDISASTFISNNNILLRTGGTMVGSLYLASAPVVGNEAATKDYVDIQIASSVGGDVVHTINNPQTTPSFVEAEGLLWEELFGTSTEYPTLPISDLFRELNLRLGAWHAPRKRTVFTANGNGTIYLGDTSSGAQPDQMNPTGALDMTYVVGSNDIEVYVNGVKQIASETGFAVLSAIVGSGSPFTPYRMWPSDDSALLAGNAYDFEINVNGQGFVLVSIAPTGGPIIRLGTVIELINEVADSMYWGSPGGAPPGSPPDPRYAFGVKLWDGKIVFYSGLPGTGSSIQLRNVTGSPDTNLLSKIGDVFSLQDPTTASTNPVNYLPADRAYNEVGRWNRRSGKIEFNSGSEPPNGSTVEVIIGREILGDPF